MRIPCQKDYECPKWQYCYSLAHCVNFTQCAHYNREEGPHPARDGSQCGPCLHGFYHSTSRSVFCRTIPKSELTLEEKYSWVLFHIIIPISVVIVVATFTYLTYKYLKRKKALSKRYSETGEQTIVFNEENQPFKPTAPPEEHNIRSQSLDKKETRCQPSHNNRETIVNDKSQNVSPFQAPSWINNATFSNGTNNQSSAQRNTVFQPYRPPAARNDPVANEQRAILMSEQIIEHEDNARNIVLQNNSSSSNDNTDNTNSTSFNDDENGNRSGEDGRTIKMVINQNIMMNVNMTN